MCKYHPGKKMSNVTKLSIPNTASKSVVARIMEFYRDFSKDSLSDIDEVYMQDVEFVDPVHALRGSLALKSYLRRMAENMLHYEMEYLEVIESEDSAHLSWEMTFVHKRLNKGRPVKVKGMSLIKLTSKVYYHEDCYDLGALVYENVPVLGRFIRMLKLRMRQEG